MATLEDLQAKVGRINTALGNIRQDIADIKANLPPTGGLTEAQVAELAASLEAAAAGAEGLDAENPAPAA